MVVGATVGVIVGVTVGATVVVTQGTKSIGVVSSQDLAELEALSVISTKANVIATNEL